MAKNLLLAGLPVEEHDRLRPYLERVSLELKEGLIEAGKPIPYVWFPEDCVTSTLVAAEGGTSIEVGLMGIEGMIGLSLFFGERISNTTVIVQVPGSAMRMKAGHFLKHVLESRGHLFQLLQRYTNAFMGMVAQSAACNSLHALEERLCRWILMTHDRVMRDEMPLTQEFLSMMLGVRRPTISMAANLLRSAGLIKYTRGTVTVIDRQALEDGACDCYSIINAQMDKIFDVGWRRAHEKG